MSKTVDIIDLTAGLQPMTPWTSACEGVHIGSERMDSEISECSVVARGTPLCSPKTCTTLFSCIDESDSDAAEEWSGPPGLRLEFGSHQVPHPDKAEYGGEDGFFVCERGCAAGIADGVSDWKRRFGVNPRHFADEVMEGARHVAASRRLGNACRPPAGELAEEMLAEGLENAESFGAATVCVMALDPATSKLGIANIGDSGVRLLRRAPGVTNMDIVARTKEQQHSFNRPFQLSRLPTPRDFPLLRARGQGRLVRVAQRSPPTDAPRDADRYDFPVQEGDLLLAGSDGLFDNLSDSEMCDLVNAPSATADRQSADLIARLLAEAAARRSEDTEATTPFTLHAKEHGHHHPGGKVDDVTVIAAWVVQGGSPDAPAL